MNITDIKFKPEGNVIVFEEMPALIILTINRRPNLYNNEKLSEEISERWNNYESIQQENKQLREALKEMVEVSHAYQSMHGSDKCEAWLKAKNILK